jgi:hypothetical protein
MYVSVVCIGTLRQKSYGVTNEDNDQLVDQIVSTSLLV